MESSNQAVSISQFLQLQSGVDVMFLLIGAVMVLAMHAGFAFLELGTVRRKNQVNALVKILVDFCVSTLAYFLVGFGIAYGEHFFGSAQTMVQNNGVELVRFFFLLTFAAAIPAIISGGIAERAKFLPQVIATSLLVGLIYPIFEGMVWHGNLGMQGVFKAWFGEEFKDFAGSVVVHTVGGWMGLVAVLLLGSRRGRYSKEGRVAAHPPSNIPFLALGAWTLTVGWFGFNVMSAQKIADISGLVAVCAGSNLMHPIAALFVGAVAGALFVYMFTLTQNRLKIDDVLGVWPLHGLCGAWGGVAAGIFGQTALGGLGGVSFFSQLFGTLLGIVIAVLGSALVYGALKATMGIRLTHEEEYNGADLSIHKIASTSDA